MKNDLKSELDILMIGSLPPPVGGARVAFQHILNELNNRERIKVSVISTWPAGNGILRKMPYALNTTLRTLLKAKQASVITFFAARGGIIFWAPFLHFIARLLGKPWILRVFGGGFDLTYTELPRWAKVWVRKTSLSADIVLFQTKHLVEYFENISHKKNILLHSNFRPLEELEPRLGRQRCNRFVFMGKVKASKGVKEIIQASHLLDQNVEIHIFGPLEDGMQEIDFEDCDKVTYCGILPPDDVIPALRRYDALLLPTYYKDEGYPGIIIEAYSVGIPVIASRWRAITEIVDESSGILVTPKDPVDLATAMQSLVKDEQLYRQLCQGAWEKRRDFSLELWTDKFIEYCKAAISGEVSRYAERGPQKRRSSEGDNEVNA